MKELSIGIIGCGGIAFGKHLPALSSVEAARISAFFDLDPARAQQAKEKYGTPDAKVYTDYRQLLDDKSVDVVHVCTPNNSHAPISIDALSAGKHVMCEKPMAITGAEARNMIAAAQKAGKKLSVAYQNRHRNDVLYLRQCKEQELGDIYYAKALALRRRGIPGWGSFLNKEIQGGGPLIDIGTHSLDLALHLMNNYRPAYVVGNAYTKLARQPEQMESGTNWKPEDYTVEDAAFGFITMENGATVVLESSWALNLLNDGEARCTLCGTRGGADMQEGLRINGVKNNTLYDYKPELPEDECTLYNGRLESPGQREARLWLECILNDTPPYVLPEEAAAVTEILEAIYRSSETGKPVFLSQNK